jgi:Family of unknown function (DUF6807)
MMASQRFMIEDDPIALPRGAWAATERRTLRLDDRPVFSLTQGRYRAYLYPLYTPAGFPVVSEVPADHPHHNAFWIAADHVHCQMPAADNRIEEYTHNFYNDDTFQGRALTCSPVAACAASRPGSGLSTSTTPGTNRGGSIPSLPSTDRRAAPRQPNTCCGVSP